MSKSDTPLSIKARAKKILALAERGERHEAEQAREALKALCEKHGITLDELQQEEVYVYTLAYRTKREKRMLVQVCCFVLRANKFSGEFRRSKLFIKCTPVQFVDISEAWAFYRKAYAEEEELLYLAFVHKHEIFSGVQRETGEGRQEDEKDFRRIFQLMEGLSGKSWKPSKKVDSQKYLGGGAT